MNLFFLCILGYLVGSIPFGFLLIKFIKGIDLRNFGSNSTGATNVFRTGDKKLAIITLALDLLKGFIFSIFVARYFDEMSLYISSLFCLIGHTHSVWLRLKGGKGVATTAGIFLALSPITALISAAIWGGVAKIFKVSSIASLSFYFSFVLICLGEFFAGYSSIDLVLFSATVSAFLLYTHRDNIKKLARREEKKCLKEPLYRQKSK